MTQNTAEQEALRNAIEKAAEPISDLLRRIGVNGSDYTAREILEGLTDQGWRPPQTRYHLPDIDGGCTCTPHYQDAGGGHTELLIEPDPACPEHSDHLYDPRTGNWVLRSEGAAPQSEDLVQPHQTWEDNDPRSKGRRFKVLRVDGDVAVVYVIRASDNASPEQKSRSEGAERRIKVSRLRHPYYKLIRQPKEF